MRESNDPQPAETPNAFEQFVRRIAAVPKAKVDAIESAERETAKRNEAKKKAS